MSGLITGEVVKILTKYSIIINVGSEDGVKRGMKFLIFDEGDRVFYKEEDLGVFEIVKGEVEITDVQEKMSVGESKEVRRVNIYAVISQSMSQEHEIKVPLPLEGDYPENLTVHPIRVGDKVKQILA